MCEMKKHLPSTFFNAQQHYLIHQVEDIELCGHAHTRSMWMVERHLKSLKAFVRQRARPKGSMVQGWCINPWCTLVGIFQIQQKISVFLAFGMSTPSTNLKGRSCWGKVE